jgi:hypothetical protein
MIPPEAPSSGSHPPTRFYLSAFETHPEYSAVLEEFERAAPLLKRLGIREIVHRGERTEWNPTAGELVIGPAIFSLEHIKKVLETLDILSRLKSYFGSVSVDHCVFPNAEWTASFIRSNMGELRKKFRSLRFTDQLATSGDTLLIDTKNLRSSNHAFTLTLVTLMREAPVLSEPLPSGPVEPLPGPVAPVQPVKPVILQRKRVRSSILETLRSVLPEVAASFAGSQFFSVAKDQLGQEAEVRARLAEAVVSRFVPATTVVTVKNLNPDESTRFSVTPHQQSDAMIFIQLEKKPAPEAIIFIERYRRDRSGVWKAEKLFFRGTWREFQRRFPGNSSK